MIFNEQKKKAIELYLVEKINSGEPSPVQSVTAAFGINKTTVYSYINELIENGVIKKLGRGRYELISKKDEYTFKRSNGELDSDTYAFEKCFEKYLVGFESNIYEIWLYVFSEMTNNVIDHSGAQTLKVFVEQNYFSTTVCLWDDGIGIFKKIKEHFSFATVDDAICELFKGKLTTDSKNHSGEGIFFSSKMMDRFYILSDNKVFDTNKYQNISIESVGSKPVGTSVVMELSNHSKKRASEIFDLYADVDGGFSKTKISLKTMFEAAPISRSQAKRVCNRLDSFEEVIFDFEDIEWMGQGFAHQIFSVFASAHPNTKLTLVNANESVKKMYNHVLKK